MKIRREVTVQGIGPGFIKKQKMRTPRGVRKKYKGVVK